MIDHFLTSSAEDGGYHGGVGGSRNLAKLLNDHTLDDAVHEP